jgi:group I intron endonuclease
MIGIYEIINKDTKKSYIGSSKQIEKRWEQHLQVLEKGEHHSILLQRAWNKYGKECFEFIVKEECKEEELLVREQKYLDLKPEYNIGAQASGGDNLTNHPYREEILERRSRTVADNLNKLTQEERNRIYGKEKEANPNWRGGKTFCKCGTRINSTARSCIRCQDRTGENNPFYNKKHTEQTKQVLREHAAKREKKPSNTKKVVVEGIEYTSANEAAKVFNISRSLVNYRCNSEKYDWQFKN